MTHPDTGAPQFWHLETGELIPVYVRPDLSESYVRHIVSAIDEIHLGAQRIVFDMPKPSTVEMDKVVKGGGFVPSAFYVKDDNGLNPEHGSATNVMADNGKILGTVIKLPEKFAITRGFQIVLHEMMHGLGFAHDTKRSSIMYEYTQHRPGSITAKDAVLLERHYGANSRYG